jgi:excisionase family DNA binding protein
MSDLLKIEQVAKVLGVSKNFLYKSVAVNSVPHLRIGRRVRFDIQKVREWMASQARRRAEERKVSQLLPRTGRALTTTAEENP